MISSDVDKMLCEEFRQCVLRNIERDPVAVAMDKHIANASLVATQVKYLQRARHKFPRLYEAGCVIPPKAFEQSSSWKSAKIKDISGGRLLDLTCGLGIDVMNFAGRFDRVVTLERDQELSRVVRYNFDLLGIDNVDVITTSAEEYVATTQEHFDWVFADPDRRSATGKKMVRMEECSPDIIALMPRLKEIAGRIGLKLSPLFDVDEAFRLFPNSVVEVVSIGGECKELNIYTDAEHEVLRCSVVGVGRWEFAREDMHVAPTAQPLDVERAKYLVIPDVALQKARVAISALKPYAQIWSNNGYAFASELPSEPLPAKVYAIERMERYNPKQLKREFKGVGVEILKRDTPLSIDALRRATGMRAGSERLMAITTIASESWIMLLK